jgi:hypothetical protein
MAKQRRTVGAILSIPLGDGRQAFCLTLDDPEFAFFDYISESLVSPDELIKRPVLFRVGVHKSAWASGRWVKIGKSNIPVELDSPQPKFIQNPLNPDKFQIYLGGVITPASKEECMGLERCAVWDPEHVEDRLRDHYAGVPNIWVEQLKLK